MYIILDLFDINHISIISDEDGNTILFDCLEDAQEYAEDLHDPLIVRVL